MLFIVKREWNNELAKKKTRLEYCNCFVLLHNVKPTASQLK